MPFQNFHMLNGSLAATETEGQQFPNARSVLRVRDRRLFEVDGERSERPANKTAVNLLPRELLCVLFRIRLPAAT